MGEELKDSHYEVVHTLFLWITMVVPKIRITLNIINALQEHYFKGFSWMLSYNEITNNSMHTQRFSTLHKV